MIKLELMESGAFGTVLGVTLGMTACFFCCPLRAAELTQSTAHQRYIQNPSQEASNVLYEKGVALAAEGKFKEAGEQFDQALAINEFNYDAEVALDIVNALAKGTINENYAITTFTSRLVTLKIAKFENILKQRSNSSQDILTELETIKKEVAAIKVNRDEKIFMMQDKIDRLTSEVELLKAKR